MFLCIDIQEKAYINVFKDNIPNLTNFKYCWQNKSLTANHAPKSVVVCEPHNYMVSFLSREGDYADQYKRKILFTFDDMNDNKNNCAFARDLQSSIFLLRHPIFMSNDNKQKFMTAAIKLTKKVE